MKNAFVEYADYNEIANFNLFHDKQILEQGVTSISIDPYMGDTVCLGFSGNDVEIFSTKSGKILNSFDKLFDASSRIIFTEFLSTNHTEDDLYELLIVSSNGDSRVLSFNTESKSISVISQKKLGNDVVQSVLHPMGTLLFSITENGRNWNLFDLENNEILYKSNPCSTMLTAINMHPDGHMLAFGDSEGEVSILEVTNNEEAARFKTNVGKIRKIDFSENGYHMLVYGESKGLEIWDLRNSEEVHKEITLDGQIKEACFDNSGRYLLAADKNFHMFDTKKFNN